MSEQTLDLQCNIMSHAKLLNLASLIESALQLISYR